MNMLLKNGIVYKTGGFCLEDILICDGIVSDVSPDIPADAADICFDLNSGHVFPGFADVHVHLREPGFSYKETIGTGTSAAARGGFTTVCAMPNTRPVPDSPENLAVMEALIEKSSLIKVYPYASITKGEKGEALVDFGGLIDRVIGFSDDGHGVQDRDMMRRAMIEVQKLGGLIAAHCEDDTLLRGGYIHDGEYARRHGHKGICSESEWRQLKRDIDLVRETRCRYHVCHVSAKESVELIRSAKAEGLPVSCETAPHYLLLCDEDLREDGRFKMNPPLRSKEDREALVRGILDGTIDLIATDHAPHSAEEKTGGLKGSLMGVVGLETAFPLLYTKLVRTGTLKLERLIELMSIAPSFHFKLGGGEIKIGEKADLTVFNLEKCYKIDPESFLTKGRASPFAGMELWGESILTIANGTVVWENMG